MQLQQKNFRSSSNVTNLIFFTLKENFQEIIIIHNIAMWLQGESPVYKCDLATQGYGRKKWASLSWQVYSYTWAWSLVPW